MLVLVFKEKYFLFLASHANIDYLEVDKIITRPNFKTRVILLELILDPVFLFLKTWFLKLRLELRYD